ncbi:MAG: hypothetical protein ACK42F_08600, partial [Sphingobacteriales bacterium]
GKEDVYINGTLKKPGRLYLGVAAGFTSTDVFENELKGYEDITALFLDADKDGDQDLFLGAGGNHRASYARENQNRLYLNDGKGKFQRSLDSLPKNMGNTAVLIS